MIGFTVQGKIYNEEGETEWATFILSLDEDAVETEGKPALDIRKAGDDALIGNFDVEDVYDALARIKSQLGEWERTRSANAAKAPA